jgi:hypothetical protein
MDVSSIEIDAGTDQMGRGREVPSGFYESQLSIRTAVLGHLDIGY